MFDAIRLRFIGENGSMGLRHGRIYIVGVHTSNNYIWVSWINPDGSAHSCPYASVAAFAANWC